MIFGPHANYKFGPLPKGLRLDYFFLAGPWQAPSTLRAPRYSGAFGACGALAKCLFNCGLVEQVSWPKNSTTVQSECKPMGISCWLFRCSGVAFKLILAFQFKFNNFVIDSDLHARERHGMKIFHFHTESFANYLKHSQFHVTWIHWNQNQHPHSHWWPWKVKATPWNGTVAICDCSSARFFLF